MLFRSWPTSKGGLWNDAPSSKPVLGGVAKCASFTGGVPLGTFTGASAILGVSQQPEYLLELVRKADVVTDNFRTGVLKRLGIDYDTLSAINPRIVCCSVTPFGTSGPMAGISFLSAA